MHAPGPAAGAPLLLLIYSLWLLPFLLPSFLLQLHGRISVLAVAHMPLCKQERLKKIYLLKSSSGCARFLFMAGITSGNARKLLMLSCWWSCRWAWNVGSIGMWRSSISYVESSTCCTSTKKCVLRDSNLRFEGPAAPNAYDGEDVVHASTPSELEVPSSPGGTPSALEAPPSAAGTTSTL